MQLQKLGEKDSVFHDRRGRAWGVSRLGTHIDPLHPLAMLCLSCTALPLRLATTWSRAEHKNKSTHMGWNMIISHFAVDPGIQDPNAHISPLSAGPADAQGVFQCPFAGNEAYNPVENWRVVEDVTAGA